MPERLFSTDEHQAQGISAVKALAIASAEGQRIWTITQDNLNEALSSINLSAEIETEIRNAILVGKVATAHEQPISFAGGTNTGYLLIDPLTGAGAYLIAGGQSGGVLQTVISSLLALAGAVASIGEFLEAAAKVGTLFKSIGGVLGSLGLLLSVLDAKLSGCGAGASIGVFAFSFAAWVGILALSLYALPLLIIIGAVVAISVAQFMITSSIKSDFCSA